MVIRAHTIQFQQDGQDSKCQEDSSRDQILVLMTRLFSRRRIAHLLARMLITFQTKLQFMAINHSTIQFQVLGQVNRFRVDNLRDQIQALTMTLFLIRRKVRHKRMIGWEHHLSTSQMLHLSMVINHFTILCQAAGPESKFQVDSLRDQTLASMMKMSLRRKNQKFKTFNKLIMFLKSHLFTVISLFTTQYQVDGLVSKSQVDNLKDQILDLMMKLSLVRRDQDHSWPPEKTMFQKRHPSMEIKVHTTLFQLDGLDNKFQADNSRDLTLVLMMKLFSAKKDLSLIKEKNMFQKKHRSMEINLCIIPWQAAGPVNRFQVDNLKDQTRVSMMKLS